MRSIFNNYGFAREQYYFDLLKPEYSVLSKAGSSFGFKHSEETKQKMKDHVRTEDEKIEHLERLKIINSPLWGGSEKQREHLKRLHSSNEYREQLKRLSESLKGRPRPEGAGIPSVTIEVFDQKTGIKTIYPSISEAALAIGVTKASISMAFLRLQGITPTEGGAGKPATVLIKKRYFITKF